ncbi:hypothetical protein [Cupriavidus pampae]|uniref:N-acetyltransferase GCN5 n=1 Tax=Cupriavidus pampae TaxID=659251 RepID=A0ABN7Z5Y4_9BURK|nr:hypothetical protein [Cupriavidus pampae]CAG9181382.1 hypothetical protein LMG32289_04815 [Cupriavidus pampae]
MITPLPFAVLTVAGLMLACPLPTFAERAPDADACVVMSLASTPQPPRCMAMDTVSELQTSGQTGRAVLEAVRIAGRGSLFLSDQPGMAGRLWKVSRSGDASALSLQGVPRAAIASAMMVPEACFYEDAGFKSRTRCHAPGPVVGDLLVLDRMISSMRVPPGLGVRTFVGKNGTGSMTAFTTDTDWHALKKRGLNDAIRSVQVVRTRLCPERCVIAAADAYDLRAMFGADWKRDANRLPQISLPLETGPDAYAMIRYGGRLTISHSSSASWVHVRGRDRGSLLLPGNARVRYTTVKMVFRVGDSVDVQLVRSDAERRFIDATPITTLPWPQQSDEVISIRNMSQRSAIVLDRPRAIVGSGTDATADPLKSLGERAVLAQYFADDRNPLAMSAAARVCRIPLARLFSMPGPSFATTRARKGIGNWEACASRVTTIVTLYQVLFPRGWDIARFRTVIRRVLDHGLVQREAGTDAEEAEFVTAIREQTDTEDTRLADAVLGFHMANVIRAYSLAARIDLEPLAADREALGAVACRTPGGQAGVSEAGANTLGWYRYDLNDYVYRVVLPQERRHGTPSQLLNEPFVISVATREDTSDIMALRVEMYEWQLRYMQALLPGTQIPTHGFRPELPDSPAPRVHSSPCRPDLPHAGRDFLAATGYSMTQGIDDALRHAYARTYADSVFVTVFFRRQPVAVLYGQIPLTGSTEAEVLMLVSAPENVLEPRRDGAIRGAGAAALNYFIQHARSQGMTAVRVQAISGPATKVTKAGFRLDDEL